MVFGRHNLELTRELAILALPMVISNLAYTLLGVTDILFLGRVSATALGAAGLANLVFLTISLVFRGAVNGVTTFVARAYGAKDYVAAGQYLIHFIIFALLLTPAVVFLPQLYQWFFQIMQPDSTVAQQALVYLHIRNISMPFNLVFTAFIGFLIGIGNTRLPALLSWTAVLINIAANYVLIFGKLGFPALGIAGAAYATVLAIIVQTLLAAVLVFRFYNEQYQLSQWSWPNLVRLGKMAKVGFPIGLADAVDVGAFATFMGLISRLGTAELAASQIVNQISSVAFMPGFALSAATGSMVGRFLGAKEPQLAEEVGYQGVRLGLSFMGLLGVVFWCVPRQLTGFFTADPLLQEVAILPMRLIAIYQIFDAMNIVFRGALNGAGDTRFGMIFTVIGAWGIFIPTVYLLTFSWGLGLAGAWGGALTYIFCLGVTFLIRFRNGRWKELAL